MKLAEHVTRHSIGVAEFMSEYAETHPDLKADPAKYYVLGLLHDIGKLFPGDPDPDNPKNEYKNHAAKGAALMEDMGFSYYKEIKHHGHPENKYFSTAWLILNLADMSINGKGEKVPINTRIQNIKKRYGDNSEQYEHAKEIFKILVNNHIIRENGTIF